MTRVDDERCEACAEAARNEECFDVDEETIDQES
jgi:hypothetical protein